MQPYLRREPLIRYPWGWIILIVVAFVVLSVLYVQIPVASFGTGRVPTTSTTQP